MFAFLAFALAGKASDEIRISSSRLLQDERQVSNFNEIEVGGSIRVYVKFGSTESLRLEGDKEAIADLITEVKNGKLTIKPKRAQWKDWFVKYKNPKIVAYITAKKLTALGVSGSGGIEVEGTITANNFSAALSGSGSIKAAVNVQSFDGAISGSGNLNFTGKAKTASVAVSGSGGFNGKGLTVDNIDAHVSGSGSVGINVEKSINAAISGSGSVNYTGNPAKIDKAVSGSGRVRKAD